MVRGLLRMTPEPSAAPIRDEETEAWTGPMGPEASMCSPQVLAEALLG